MRQRTLQKSRTWLQLSLVVFAMLFTTMISAQISGVLEISYTGYATQSLTLGNETTLNIALAQGVALDEVVVTGYSTQRKRDITGAVAVVDASYWS